VIELEKETENVTITQFIWILHNFNKNTLIALKGTYENGNKKEK
jgi:hypothetical protein